MRVTNEKSVLVFLLMLFISSADEIDFLLISSLHFNKVHIIVLFNVYE